MTNRDVFSEGAGPIPRPNVQALATSLREGRISISTAIEQISCLVRDTLKTIEDFAQEQARLNQDRKSKLDKMDKIINDLSEKCQGMQQALLYKEEKYDEKCREVERYKVICELINNHSPSRSEERMETIGGINVRGSFTTRKGPPVNSGPVTLERLINTPNDSNKRVKVVLTSQRNDVMSSSGNLAHQMKQRIVEKDLHRQIAEGCWTRITSRRKKDWPF
jgi:hypothetical protein